MRFREAPPAVHVAPAAFRQEECYTDSGEPYATPQEMDDAMAVAASVSSEMDSIQAEIDEAGLEVGDEMPSGPSVGGRCTEQAVDASFAAAGAGIALAAMYAANAAWLAVPATISTGGLGLAVAGMIVGIGAFAFAGGLLLRCLSHQRELGPDGEDDFMVSAVIDFDPTPVFARLRRLSCPA